MILRIALALVLGAGLTFGGVTAAQRYEDGIVERVRSEQVGRIHDRAVARSRDLEQILRETAMYFGERDVSLLAFEPRLMAVSDLNPVFRVVSWLPVVQRADAETFLAEIRRPIPDFALREIDPDTGAIRGAGDALAWIPFLLLQPEHGNDMLRGVDLGNHKALAETMQRTYQIDGVAASAPVTVFPPDGEPSFLLLHYVQKPEGFVGAILPAAPFLEHVMEGAPKGLVGRLVDVGRGTEPLVAQEGFVPETTSVAGQVVVGGRRLSLEVATTDAYAPVQRLLAPAVGFAGGGVTFLMLALTLLSGAPAREEAR